VRAAQAELENLATGLRQVSDWLEELQRHIAENTP
jgi:hypothetical protein